MRIADLYDELTNPTPRGFEKWFERKSGVRYVMMATIAGVLFAIFLGMASLVLGVIRHGLSTVVAPCHTWIEWCLRAWTIRICHVRLIETDENRLK